MSKCSDGGDLVSYHPNIEAIREKHSINMTNRWSNMTEQEKIEYSEKMKRDGNPNWQGGLSIFVCPICKKEFKKQYSAKQETCKKCRNRSGESNPFYGKQHSDETKEKIRNHRLKHPILVTKIKVEIDGIVYSSFSEAAKSIGCSVATIRNRLNRYVKFPNYKLIQQ